MRDRRRGSIHVEALEERIVLSSTVSKYRDALNAVAGLTATSYPFASYLLHHSLHDNTNDVNLNKPTGDISAQSANAYLNEIQTSPLLRVYLLSVLDSSAVGHTSGSTQNFVFSGLNDPHLALNKVSLSWTLDKTATGFGTFSATVQDRYDFQDTALQFKSLNSIVSTAMNKVGADAQKVGAVVPYNISANVTVTLPDRGTLLYQDNVYKYNSSPPSQRSASSWVAPKSFNPDFSSVPDNPEWIVDFNATQLGPGAALVRLQWYDLGGHRIDAFVQPLVNNHTISQSVLVHRPALYGWTLCLTIETPEGPTQVVTGPFSVYTIR